MCFLNKKGLIVTCVLTLFFSCGGNKLPVAEESYTPEVVNFAPKKAYVVIRSEGGAESAQRVKNILTADFLENNVSTKYSLYRAKQAWNQNEIFNTAYRDQYDYIVLIDQIAKFTIDNRTQVGGKYQIRSYHIKSPNPNWLDLGQSTCNFSVVPSVQKFSREVIRGIVGNQAVFKGHDIEYAEDVASSNDNVNTANDRELLKELTSQIEMLKKELEEEKKRTRFAEQERQRLEDQLKLEVEARKQTIRIAEIDAADAALKKRQKQKKIAEEYTIKQEEVRKRQAAELDRQKKEAERLAEANRKEEKRQARIRKTQDKKIAEEYAIKREEARKSQAAELDRQKREAERLAEVNRKEERRQARKSQAREEEIAEEYAIKEEEVRKRQATELDRQKKEAERLAEVNRKEERRQARKRQAREEEIAEEYANKEEEVKKRQAAELDRQKREAERLAEVNRKEERRQARIRKAREEEIAEEYAIKEEEVRKRQATELLDKQKREAERLAEVNRKEEKRQTRKRQAEQKDQSRTEKAEALAIRQQTERRLRQEEKQLAELKRKEQEQNTQNNRNTNYSNSKGKKSSSINSIQPNVFVIIRGKDDDQKQFKDLEDNLEFDFMFVKAKSKTAVFSHNQSVALTDVLPNVSDEHNMIVLIDQKKYIGDGKYVYEIKKMNKKTDSDWTDTPSQSVDLNKKTDLKQLSKKIAVEISN